MELIRGLHNLGPQHRGCVATIGNYDGVHLGHRAVLQRLQAESTRLGLPGLVMTFEPTSREFFAREQAPPRIASLRERLEDLAAAGVKRVLCLRFDARLATWQAEDFVRQLLVQRLGIRFLAVGDDFRFGQGRRGDFALLRAMGRDSGFAVEAWPAVMLDGERVSSSRIRQALAAGEPRLAARLLGRPYRISGRVVGGQRLGRQLGMPTANLPLAIERAARHGVYVARVAVHGHWRPAVMNLGLRPTVGTTACLLEAHLLDFDGDLYGKRIDVQLLDFLRPEQRFTSLEELRVQMQRDRQAAERWFAATPVTAGVLS